MKMRIENASINLISKQQDRVELKRRFAFFIAKITHFIALFGREFVSVGES